MTRRRNFSGFLQEAKTGGGWPLDNGTRAGQERCLRLAEDFFQHGLRQVDWDYKKANLTKRSLPLTKVCECIKRNGENPKPFTSAAEN
jgi:hypothetical protein